MALKRQARPHPLAPLFSALLLFMLVCSAFLPPLSAAEAPKPAYSVPRLSQAPTIDGRLDEWSKLPPLLLGEPTHVARYPTWMGPLDCSAKLWLGWDEKAFYLAVEVADNRFWQDQYDPFFIWADDSLMVAFDPRLDYSSGGFGKDDRVFGWADFGDKATNFCWQGPESPHFLPDLPGQGKAVEGGWTYEVSLPWEKLGLAPKVGQLLGFSCLVNDTDVDEREGWVSLTEWADWTNEHNPGPLIGPKSFAVISLAAGQPQEAAEVVQARRYRLALERLPKQLAAGASTSQAGSVQLWRGHLQLLYGKLPQAEQAYQKVLSDYPRKPVAAAALAALADLYRRTDRLPEAVSLSQSFLKAHAEDSAMIQPAVRNLNELLTSAYGQADTLAALQKFAAGLGHDKPLLRAELHLAIAINYRSQLDYRAAIAELHSLLADLPADSPFRARAINQLAYIASLALEATDKPDAETALLAFDIGVIPTENLTAQALSVLAWVYDVKGNTLEARATRNELLARFPTDQLAADIRGSLAQEQLQAGRQREAESTLKDILRLHPTLDLAGMAGYMLGDLYVGQKKYAQALERYRASAGNPGFRPEVRARAAVGMGNVLAFYYHKYDAARKAFEQARQLAPTGDIAQQAEGQIKVINQR